MFGSTELFPNGLGIEGVGANSKAIKGGINADECRKKRQEATVQIRKNRREDQLRNKRRMEGRVGTPDVSSGATIASDSQFTIEPKLSQLDAMMEAMRTQDIERRLGGTKALRKLLSRQRDPPVQEVVDAGFLPLLCEALKEFGQPMLQFESAWALTNIGSSDLTCKLVEAGILPYVVPLLQSAEPSVREQAAWCIGNIAGDCSEYRDLVLNTEGALEGLVVNLQHPANINMMRNVTWSVSNLCRGANPKPELAKIAPLVPILACIIRECGDEETIIDACWALSYVSDGENSRLEPIIQSGICPILVRLLATSPNSKCVSPALRVLGNVVTGDDEQTQHAIDCGLLKELVPLMSNIKTTVRKEAAWTASNITGGTKEQIGAFLSMPGLPKAIVKALEEDEWVVKKECAWTISNLCSGGSAEHVRAIVETYGVLEPMCELLKCQDAKIVSLILSALDTILKVDEHMYKVQIEEFDGLETIEDLQNHSSDQIYEKARRLIEDYFGTESDDEEDDENVVPNIDLDNETFSFSKPMMPNTNFNFSNVNLGLA